MSANQFLAFYHVHPIDKWSFNRVEEYYREKTGLKEKKKLLDSIKKDLQKVRNKSEFDADRRSKAEEILNDWKEWTGQQTKSSVISVKNLKINNAKHIATSGATQFNHNHITGDGYISTETDRISKKRKQVPNSREKSPTEIDHNDINYNDIDNDDIDHVDIDHDYIDNDDIDHDDYEIDESLDPINKTKSDSKFLSVQKYPDESSPPDFWRLPSGYNMQEVIRRTTYLHKSHPSHLNIIRVGANVQKPKSIQLDDWNYLQSSVEYSNVNLSSDVEALINSLLRTDTLSDYQQCLHNAQFDYNNKQMVFVINVLKWFATNVFPFKSTFHSLYKGEAILGSLMVHPILQYLVNATNGQPYYVPGEICLKASANQRFIRRDLKPTDDKPLGMKVDGMFCSPGEQGYEIGMVELSGGYLTSDMPRYLKDHVKGFCGCRDLLNDILLRYSLGDFKIMRHLRVWFLHCHGLDVQVWGMDLPVSQVYRMFLIDTFKLPISWDEHYKLARALKILWNLGIDLDNTLEILEKLKKSHRKNATIDKQSSTLKNFIRNMEDSPKKPVGKMSRIVNPVFRESNY